MPTAAPLAMVAVNIRATNQLQGTLDEYNLELASLIDALNPSTGLYEPMKETGNPADWKRRLETMPLQANPVGLDELNDAEIRAWHAHNVTNGLTFSRIYDYDISLQDMILDVCHAGRARPRMINGLRGVTVDEPKDEDQAYPLTPHNSWGFEGKRNYGDLAHAFRVKFRDRTNRFREAVRDVVRPGFVGTPTKFDILEPPGLTDPSEAYVFGYLKWLEIIHRPDTYTVSLDWETRMLDRGDLVLLMHRVLHTSHKTGFVSAVSGRAISLTEPVTMKAGKTYAIKFRKLAADGSETASRLVTWPVATQPGETQVIRLSGGADLPEVGELFSFGEAEALNVVGLVTRVEPTEDGCGRLTVIPYAPQIFTDLLEVSVPPYSSRVGSELPDDTRPPAVPAIEAVLSSDDLYDDDEPIPTTNRRIRIYVRAGQGAPKATTFDVRDRKLGETSWRTPVLTATSSDPSVLITTGYAKGDQIECQPLARSRLGVPSAWGAVFPHTVGEDDVAGPVVTSFTATETANGFDKYAWVLPAGAAGSTAQIRIGPSGSTNFDAMTPIHTGYLTASPYLVDNPTTPGTYAVAIQLTNDDGDVGAPFFITYVLTAAGTPTAPFSKLTGSIVDLSAKSARNDKRTASIEARRWTPAGPFDATAGVVIDGDPQDAVVNQPVYWTDSPGPGVWRYGFRAFNASSVPSTAFATATPDITIPGQIGSDSFNRADGALGSPWLTVGSASATASIVSNKINATAGSGSARKAYYFETYATRHYAEAAYQTTVSGISFPVAVRIQDDGNLVGARWVTSSGGQWQILLYEAGATTTLQTAAQTTMPAAGTILRLEADGNAVTLKVNGTAVMSAVSLGGKLPSATKAGFLIRSADGALLDDAKVGILS